MVVAAVPEVIEGNVSLLVLLVFLLVALAVLRWVRKAATRIGLMGLLILGAYLVILQRDEIERCGKTCSCELFTRDVDVPWCGPEPFFD